MRRFGLIGLIVGSFVFGGGGPMPQADAAKIGFIEDFALAKNRERALSQLIPGTEDYYYFNALHFQHTEQFDKVSDLLTPWVKRHGRTQRYREIEHRQALLTYQRTPQNSLDYLKRELNLRLNHQRQRLGEKPNLPTKLDPKQISRETLTQRALTQQKDLQGFEDAALDWVIDRKLSENERWEFLKRIDRPDYENLVDHIIADLGTRHSGGFGYLEIHKKLLLAQLNELLEKKPDLRNAQNFVNTYLQKLRPSDDVDWPHDDDAQLAYLERLWSFVSTLEPRYNTLKAHVLYHRLKYDLKHGVFNKQRFMTYLALPRQIGYMKPDYLRSPAQRNWNANLGENFQGITLFPAIRNDESLVRAYLAHFFLEETDIKPYAKYVNDVFLRKLLAETKIVNWLGDPEQWASLLSPEEYRTLKDRVDLDFAPTNPDHFDPEDPVSLDVSVKNVRNLLIKVYEINTLTWYRQSGREVRTDINLDGLVPNSEQTQTYDEPPVRRIKRHFEFPALDKRGVYVIDFIGNGRSSRAVIRKGRLHFVMHTDVSGHVFTVLDSKNEVVPNAELWLGGQKYTADKNHHIAVPFTASAKQQLIILCADDFCSLTRFPHQQENYTLQAGFLVDREALLKNRQARVLIRPQLLVQSVAAPLELLKNVSLTIVSTDLDGVTATQRFSSETLKLSPERESVVEFNVPDRLSKLLFTLEGKVENLSQGDDASVSASRTFEINQIDRSDKISDLFLAEFSGEYFANLLGRSGEPLADRPVRLEIKHRDFTRTVQLTLQTNAAGRIELGQLVGVEWVKATGPSEVPTTWTLLHDEHTQFTNKHGIAGVPVEVPLMPTPKTLSRDDVSLLEVRGGTFVEDHFDALTLEDGLLRTDALPPGDYDLYLKRTGEHVRIRLTEGDYKDGYILGDERYLEVVSPRPLQIAEIRGDDDKLLVQLRNTRNAARVHVVATRYRPVWSAFQELAQLSHAGPKRMTRPNAMSAYVEGRNIGDEYRYILDRQYAPKFPGNMLERPSVLLNPWAVRETETGQQAAQKGDEFAPTSPDVDSMMATPKAAPAPSANNTDYSNLDFLADQSVTLFNLVPDENGLVTIDRKEIGPHAYLQVVAVDPQNVASRLATLPEPKRRFRDLRLAESLDADKHFALQKKISVLKAGEKFQLNHLQTARFEAYDSLTSVYGLFVALSQNAELAKFRFLLNWPSLSDEEKREKYSEFASHEVSFFIAQKDPEFFRNVVVPYLQNKKDKTFLDHYLLEDDLSRFLSPWEYNRLNAAERAFLAARIEAEKPFTIRDLKDLLALQPPNPARDEQLFQTAIKGTALSTSDRFGLQEFSKQIREEVLMDDEAKLGFMTELQSAAPGMGGGGGGFGFGGMVAGEPMASDKKSKSESKPSAARKRRYSGREMAEEMDADFDNAGAKWNSLNVDGIKDRLGRRANARQLFRKLDKTKEWIENNYWHLPMADQDSDIVPVNEFWADFAAHDHQQPFFSEHFAKSAGNIHEMLLALAVLDLPFEAKEHDVKLAEDTMTLTPGGSMVVFHEEIEAAGIVDGPTPVLITQNVFRLDDRYRIENGEKSDKYVTDEFLTHAVYGCQIVVTNPTSTRQKLRVLTQVPVGAFPVGGSQFLKSIPLDLEPFHTHKLEYHFYFPLAGEFQHYPAHVAEGGQTLAHAEAMDFQVVSEPSKIDRESWVYISQLGSNEEVIEFLNSHNLRELDLDAIAFRMKDKAFFNQVTDLLARRHVYNDTLWAYSVLHNDVENIREFLAHSHGFLDQCGDYLQSPLVTIDPVRRHEYQHRDYRPLVNARTHRLGADREILNDRFHAHYHEFLKILGYHRELSDEQRMAVTYYLLLQDRIGEALAFFGEVQPNNLETRLQYDYFAAYLAMYQRETERAATLARKHENHPVDRWRNAFVAVSQQIQEITGGDVQLADPKDRNQQQTKLAATDASFDFRVENETVEVDYQNLKEVQVNFYLMDVELLFSRNPFVQAGTERFGFIKPNQTMTVNLPADGSQTSFELPEDLRSRNVLVQLVGGGQTTSKPYYANSLSVTTSENYGQLLVRQAKGGKPEPTVYVKVYARKKDGSIEFYKDGYTDLRGRFDYVSLSTNEVENVSQFALLILSDEHGAIVREAKPPQR
ncbi:hypothetical protein [Thalassoroseus pseudoceratinae]|uniref:hypothetical protein n=1 Tax=Thalassoroseus pseudoceratinae TaxID=2713176 RepID=UPI00141E5779|nr:hypothetical protein [Thalassoroseus pseudoceratinae]